MPGEVGGIGAKGCLGYEGERAAVEIGEFEVRAAGEDGFGDVGLRDLDAEVVIDGPEARVEEAVGGRGQGQAVVWAVRATLGVGVDVCGLQGDIGRLGRYEAVTRQGAGEVVARDDRDLEASAPTTVNLGIVGGLVLVNLCELIGGRFWHT